MSKIQDVENFGNRNLTPQKTAKPNYFTRYESNKTNQQPNITDTSKVFTDLCSSFLLQVFYRSTQVNVYNFKSLQSFKTLLCFLHKVIHELQNIKDLKGINKHTNMKFIYALADDFH